MKIERHSLLSAAEKIGIPSNLSEKLWEDLSLQSSSKKIDFARVLYYFGALLVISAMSWFMVDALDSYGPLVVFLIALSYLTFFFLLGSFFWNKKKLQIPGGLFITLSVCMIPLVIYSLQKWLDFESSIPFEKYKNFFNIVRSKWLLMEIATVFFGFIVFYFYRFPFLMMPIFVALWYMSMDITPLFIGNDYSFEIYKINSIVFGALLLFIAYIIDIKSRKDFAFWPYFFGLITFWGGLTFFEVTAKSYGVIYLIINLGLIIFSILLQRTVFLIFGSLGVFVYISNLFYKYFSDSLNFPIILSFIGIFIVFLGILYQKNHLKIESFLMKLLPDNIKKWLPRHKSKI